MQERGKSNLQELLLRCGLREIELVLVPAQHEQGQMNDHGIGEALSNKMESKLEYDLKLGVL